MVDVKKGQKVLIIDFGLYICGITLNNRHMTKKELLDSLAATPCPEGLAAFEAWEGDAFSYFEQHPRGKSASEWCARHGALRRRKFFEFMVYNNAYYPLRLVLFCSIGWTKELFHVAVRNEPYYALCYAYHSRHWTPELRAWAEAQ